MLSAMIATVFSALLLAAAGEVQVPAKTNIELALETPIDEKVTAGNPEITFKLVHDLKKNGVVFAAKGATVTARVTRIQKQRAFIRNERRQYFIVGLALVSINAGGTAIPLTAELETVRPTATNDYFLPYAHGPEKWGEFSDYLSLFTIPTPQPGESILGVVREYLKVAKGVRMVFRTPESRE